MATGRDWSGVVAVVVEQLRRYYVDREVAERVVAVLQQRLADGHYDNIDDDESFAAAVTDDTVRVSTDLHLRLDHSLDPLPVLESPIVPESGHSEEFAALTGHGFTRVERLAGNVGVVEMHGFYPARMSGHAAVAAMNLVATTDALIIDLRRCPGGEPDMVALVESYLFDERTQMNDLYFPAEDRTIQWWTDPFVPGPRFGGTKPVWIVLSAASYSASEGFTYDLQQRGRATVVGEPTVAGVVTFHFRYRVGEHLRFAVPSGYPRHPVSGRSWAPDGIQPDVRVDADSALDTAYALALEHVITLGDAGHRRRVAAEAQSALADLRAQGIVS